MNQTRIHLETSPLSRVIPEDHQLVSAEVEIPAFNWWTGKQQMIFAYPAWWLALHALSRMLDAEEELESHRVAITAAGRPNQAQHSAREKAQTERLLALLELAHLYRIYKTYRKQGLNPECLENVTVANVAQSARQHNLALAEHGRHPFFHRMWRSLTQRKDRRQVEVVADPILDGTFEDCGTALSEFLRDKCKDPVNPARPEYVGSTAYFAHFALFDLAEQVGCP